MNYEEFKQQFTDELRKVMQDDHVTIRPMTVLKNNDQRLDALSVRQSMSAMAPCIYIQDYYDNYLRGDYIDELAEEARRVAIKAMVNVVQTPQITREIAEKVLYVTVVNAAANKELLADTPHRIISDDLAIVPRFRVDVDGTGASCRISNELLSRLQMTKDELLQVSISNTEKQQFTCRSMQDVMQEMFMKDMGEDYGEIMDALFPGENPNIMWVLTNKNSLNGASVLACPNVLADAMEQVGEPCYILPASIHEVLLVPKSGHVDLQGLKDMVYEVNREAVSAEDFLSDSVYELNPKTKKLQIATGEVEVKKQCVSHTMKHSM